MVEGFRPPTDTERMPTLTLVHALRLYGQPLPVDFIKLRILTDVARERVDEVLQHLREEGVVTLEGENVVLVQKG